MGNTAIGVGTLSSGGTSVYSIALGYEAGYKNLSGTSNTFIGERAGYYSTGGSYTINIGQQVAHQYVRKHNVDKDEIFIGRKTARYGYNLSGSTAIGRYAMANASGATGVIAIGEQAAMSATNANTGIFIGQRAGRSGNTTTNSIAIGNNTFFSGTNIINCIAIGTDAAKFQHIASDTINIGREAGMSISGSGHGGHHSNTMQSINIGFQAGSTPGINQTHFPYPNGAKFGQAKGIINIGRLSGKHNTNTDDINIGASAGSFGRWKTGSGSGWNINVGYQAGAYGTSGKDNVRIGSDAGYSGMNASHSIAIGSESLYSGSNASYAIAMGRGTSYNFIGGTIGGMDADAPLAIGHYSNQFKTGETQNTYIGHYAGRGGTSVADITPQTGEIVSTYKESTKQVAIGFKALEGVGGATYKSDSVVAIGYKAGLLGLSNSLGQILIGHEAGAATSTFNGGYGIGIGFAAAYQATNSKESTFIGTYAGYGASNQKNGVYIGYGAGRNDKGGQWNTHIGDYVAYDATNNISMSSLGQLSNRFTSNSEYGTSIGMRAGYSGFNMNYTTSVGTRAGYSGRSDFRSTFIGAYAGLSAGWQDTTNTTRGYNVAVGYTTMQDVTGGTHNVAIGNATMYEAGKPWGGVNNTSQSKANIAQSYNTYIGNQTAQYTRSSEYNIGIGHFAMRSGHCASENIAIGRLAAYRGSMKSGTAGGGDGRNISIGKESFYSGTSAEDAIAIGSSASYLGGGSYNVALGRNSLKAATGTTNANHMLHDSNIAVGNNAALFMYSGTSNIFIGRGAGNDIDELASLCFRSGSNNIYIGTYAAPGIGNASGSNDLGIANHREIVIGHSIEGKGSDTTFIGGTAIYNLPNTTTWNTTSDERLKKNITDSPKGLEEIYKLQIRNYEWKENHEIEGGLAKDLDTGVLKTGVIAQEVLSVFPEAIVETDSGVLGISTDPLIYASIKAIQELKDEIDSLRLEIKELKKNK